MKTKNYLQEEYYMQNGLVVLGLFVMYLSPDSHTHCLRNTYIQGHCKYNGAPVYNVKISTVTESSV